MNNNNQIKKTNPLRYAIGMFGTSIPVNMFKSYAAAYYVDKLGLIDVNQFATILFIYTFIDAIDNPVYGFLSDRTRSPWGRRKPWIILGTPLLILSFIAFFNIPGSLAQGGAFWYILVMYILTGTLDSLINASYGALFPELFSTEKERALTNAMRQAFQLIAMVLSIVLTPIITREIGYTTTSLIYGILAGIVLIFSALGYRENSDIQQDETPKFITSLLSIIKNKKFWILGITNAFYSGAMSLVIQGVPFYSKYTLQEDALGTTILQGTVILLAIVCLFVWFKIIEKMSLMPAWRSSLVALSAGFLLMFFATNLISASILASIIGFGMAGALATMDMVGSKIMDEDVAMSGIHREGIYSSMLGFMNRLSGLFVSAGFLLVNVLYGYENGEKVGHNPYGAGKFLMVSFPFVLTICSCIASRFLKFSDENKNNNIKG